MEKNYRYHLLKYKGRNTRYRCLGCGRPRCFTPYVDENDVPADVERYGRCDHEQSCGYNLYPPYEPNRQGGKVYALPKFRKRPEKNRKELETKLDTLPLENVGKTLLFTPKNGFIAFLSELFGEHLLPRYPDLPVPLVKAEKTAVICSAVFPEFLWLATGGLSQFNDRVNVLLGRNVIAIPDLCDYELWRKKAREYPMLDITVSDYLEKNATEAQREMGRIWRWRGFLVEMLESKDC